MSNRDSLGFGELLPQDVVHIFSHEKQIKRGRKKRSHSLGRALGWLKGKKRKDLDAKGQHLGLGPALDLALDGHPAGHKAGQRSGRQAHPQAVPKRDDDDKTPAPPLIQENVFIEASRPTYLENLHSEALEGLKMMQQEETNNGVEYHDNESTVSTMTVHTDGEAGFMTDSTIADSTSVVSVQSSVSTRSSRSGLTRQESTFRPLKSDRKSEKGRTRRRHRKTVAGIPKHVQRELGLDRVGWTVTQRLDEEQLYNGESDMSPTTDGPQPAAESQKEASTRLQDMNVTQPLNKEQLEQLSATHAGHRDDLALLHCLGSNFSDEHRPQSLAVPWMTTANSLQQEPPSPVMSMSPQAAYMSKIIPNAVLPPSIDVVEISRGRSRNSVRTVSKSSLVLSSPAPSRASSRASNTTSASCQSPPIMSDSSCWSHSESSETLVSDSSTISSSSTPIQKRSEEGDGSAKEDKISVHSFSKASKFTSNGKLIVKRDEVKKEAQFVRSLSVIKSKRAPPPPSRSYSLHNKMKRRSRDLAEVKVIPGESSLPSISASGEENEKNTSESSPMPSKVIDSPGYSADTSSLEDSTGSVSFSPIRSKLQAEKAAKVEESASKDSSPVKQKPLQENKLSKIVSPSSGYSSSSPKHKSGLLAKLQRFFPGSTSPSSTPSPLSQREAPENTKDLKSDTSVGTASASPSVRALRELFNIPPPPKVHAPPPPPPEVWSHSKRSIELLLGPPAPGTTYSITKKNPKDRRQQRKSPSGSTEGLVVERKHKNPTITVKSVNGSLQVLETKKVPESGILNAEIHSEINERLVEQNVDLEGNRKVTEKEDGGRVSDILNGMLVKAVARREERLAAMKEVKKTQAQATEVKTNTDTLPAISLGQIHPSPSPPPVHSPPRPPTKQTTGVNSLTSVQVVVSPEVSWPPPPPPIVETDFPLPPPPMFSEEGFVIPVQVPAERSITVVDSSSTTTSGLSVGKTECVRVTTSQGIVPPPLNIPPPPSYTAPPPPIVVTPPMIKKGLSPLPEEISPLPPPKEFSPPPPKEVSPQQPPKEFFPHPPRAVSPLPPPKEVSPQPPKEVFPPPLPKHPPKEVFPPPPKEFSPLPPKEVSPLPPDEVSLPPPEEIPPPPPREVAPPLLKEVSLLPPNHVSPPPPTEISAPPPPLVEDISSTLVTMVSPSPVKEVSPPLVITISPLPPKEVSTLSTEEVSPPSSQDNAHKLSEEPTPACELAPPQSIPPPPPVLPQPQSSEQESDLPQENIPSASETYPVSSNSILTPPQSIPPPPPPVALLHQTQVVPPNTDGPVTQEASPSPPCEVSIPLAHENSPSAEKAQEPAPSPPVSLPLPPPSAVQDIASIKDQPSPASTEIQTLELTPASAVQEESTSMVTPSLLQTVKLRSVNSSPEPPKAQEQSEAEVTLRNQQPSNQAPTTSAGGEAPQKPIRRSLIVISSPPSSPPPIVTSQPSLPKSQSLVLPPASSSVVISPTKKSPPAMTASPSMNLQEAIRLRTAARAKSSPASRLSLHSPTSPVDLHKSPSSTASFIFSKSNKKVVIETKPAPETKAIIQKSLVSSDTKVVSEEELMKKDVKVPPPVAKKPKTKGKEIETCEGTEQTAG